MRKQLGTEIRGMGVGDGRDKAKLTEPLTEPKDLPATTVPDSSINIAAVRNNTIRTRTRIAEIRESLAKDSIVEDEKKLISEDSELERLYQHIIEKGDFRVLQEKSAKQVNQLSDRYYGPTTLRSFIERRHKKAKLKLFEEFVKNLAVVRADSKKFDEYKSPEQTGEVKSYGPYDIMAHSEQFVYGSLAKIGHMMSQGGNQNTLDTNDIAPRAQIIMNDVANVAARTHQGESIMKKYINNMFDFENGQRILALYLASVFDTAEQAEDVLSRSGGIPSQAQRWDSTFPPIYHSRTNRPSTQEENRAQIEAEKELSQKFLTNMMSILAETGIEPPLSVEVRVKDSAKTLR